MRLSPRQLVEKEFGGRAALVDRLADDCDQLHGDTPSEMKSRLMGLSNRKLLRLYRVEQTVRERFGDRAKLVAHILERRKAAGQTADSDYEAKLDTYSKARLLDLVRERMPARPEKLTPEQKLACKRGKKQRARALAKHPAS